MTRYLWIPVTGTIAAFVAVLLAHPARDDQRITPPTFPPAIENPLEPEEPEIPEDPDAPEPPENPEMPLPPSRMEWHLLLEPDGSLRTEAGDASFATPEEALERLAPEGKNKPKILLTNASPAVTQEALAAVAAKLSPRCDLTQRYYRAPEEEKKSGDTGGSGH